MKLENSTAITLYCTEHVTLHIIIIEYNENWIWGISD